MGNGNYCKFSNHDYGEMKISKKGLNSKRFSHSKMGIDNLQFSVQKVYMGLFRNIGLLIHLT